MSDEKPPEQPTTKEIPKVDPVMEMLKQLREAQDAGFRTLGADIQLVSNDVTIVKDRVGLVEQRVGVLEESRARTSGGVRQLSSHDHEQDAQLAAIITETAAVKKEVVDLKESQAVQLAILGRLDKLASNPHVKIILAVLGTAATTWLASKGLK
jgi:hypothetical protein